MYIRFRSKLTKNTSIQLEPHQTIWNPLRIKSNSPTPSTIYLPLSTSNQTPKPINSKRPHLWTPNYLPPFQSILHSIQTSRILDPWLSPVAHAGAQVIMNGEHRALVTRVFRWPGPNVCRFRFQRDLCIRNEADGWLASERARVAISPTFSEIACTCSIMPGWI